MTLAIGIDFGTTNSVVAFARADGHVESLTWPSAKGETDTFRTALMFWREGRHVRHVAGPKALDLAISNEQEQRFIQSIKTHLASALFTETRLYSERFTIEKLVAIFLTHLLEGAGDRVSNALPITSGRPVVFAGERPDEDLAVERLKSAYALAGYDNVDLAYEPLGAAYWYARNLKRDETVLVADFGGGTSDFSILKFKSKNGAVSATPLAHGGVGIAGDTFDYRLLDHLVAPKLGKGTFYRSQEKRLPLPAYLHASFAQWHQLSWLKSAQTLAKIRDLQKTSEAPEGLEDLLTIIEMDLGFELYQVIGALKAQLSEQDKAHLSFASEGVSIEADVTRDEFESWIAPDLAAIETAMDDTLISAGLAPEAIDAVFMTGGTSYVPAVRNIFNRRFGADKIHIGNAFQSVASGLALLALDRANAPA